MVARRAYSEMDKLAKRQEILMSAEDLFIKQDGEFPTVNAICTYTSMAKGTVYLYFQNKEEIVLALLEKYFVEWLDPSKLPNKAITIDDVINVLTNFIIQNPYKFKLLNNTNFLESNASSEKVVEFYETLLQCFNQLTEVVSDKLNAPMEKVNQWLLDSYYYNQGLWRTANPSFQNKTALANSSLEVFMPDFESNSKRLMKMLWEQA